MYRPYRTYSGLFAAIFGLFSFVGLLVFVLGTQSCKKNTKAPKISVGVHADFSMRLESFLNKLSEREHTPVVHALIFLSLENLDPDFYTGKTIHDARHISLSDELRYKLNGLTAKEILSMAHTQFNRVQREQAENLNTMKGNLQKNKERFEQHIEAEERLYKIKFSDLDFEYVREGPRVTSRVSFNVTNGTKDKISIFEVTIQFKDRTNDQYYSIQELQPAYSPPIQPGESRFFNKEILRNAPLLGDLPLDQYAKRLEPIFILENAFDEQGTAFRKLPNAALIKSIQDQEKDVEYLEEVLKKSRDRKKFTFWSILSAQPEE